LADLISAQNGSPKQWSLMGQVFSSTMVLDTYVRLAGEYQWVDERAGMMGNPVRVRRAPVGVVAGITPWNVPLFIAAMKLGPAMVAGCPIVLKPAPETPLDSFLLAEAAIEAGVPAGVINIVPAGRETGEYLVRHAGIDKVSFTGSSLAGAKIGEICGAQLKRCTLELGGKSAAIVLEDVVLSDALLNELVQSGMMNNGQVCGAQTRVLAPRSRYDEVVEAMAGAVGALKVGDALDPATQIGPLVAERQRTRVMGYLDSGRSEGARVVVGGGRPKDLSKGWFVEPTIFADVNNGMKIAREEIFGPVVSVIPYDGEDEAVKIANDSDYGLCGRTE
jgi:acyl-CoA reductase-like NAD-dependent aldehyde dehydrogenase